jgi:hypothetical protein
MGGLENHEIADAGTDTGVVTIDLNPRSTFVRPTTHECVAMLPPANGHAPPRVLGKIDSDATQLGVSIQEMPAQPQTERLRLVHGFTRRKRVHRVLHGVGWEDMAVVAVRVRLVVLAVESNGDREIAHCVPISTTQDLDEPDARFPVR